MRIVEPSAKLIAVTKEPTELIERSGRTCYKSEGNITRDSASKFVAMITKRGHESVIEHASASFRIVTDRGISHEIVRHRLASYSQESTRYCNYAKDKFDNQISVVEPSGLTAEQRSDWARACRGAESAYLNLLKAGVKPQSARSVLPTCLKTELVMTANFREWCHFINLRLSAAAHPDIRPIAYSVWSQLNARCPAVFGRFEENARTCLYNPKGEIKGTA